MAVGKLTDAAPPAPPTAPPLTGVDTNLDSLLMGQEALRVQQREVKGAEIIEKAAKQAAKDKVSAGDAFHSGMSDTNVLVAAGSYAFDRATWSFDDPTPDGWKPEDYMKGYEEYASHLLEAKSPMELTFIKSRIDQNKLQKEQIANGGAMATLGMLAGGLMDPFSLALMALPGGLFIKGGQVASSAGRMVLGGAAANLPQEVILHQLQPLRTKEESVVNVVSGALLDGVLGGVVGKFTKPEVAAMTKEVEKHLLDGVPLDGRKLLTNDDMVGGGAAAVRAAGGGELRPGSGLLASLGLDKLAIWAATRGSPIARTMAGHSTEVRRTSQALAEGGMRVEGTVEQAIETNLQREMAGLVELMTTVRKLEHESGLDADTFATMVADGRRSGMQGRDATVPQVAEAVRRSAAHEDRIWDAAFEARIPGTFREITDPATGAKTYEKVNQTTSGGYFTRMYDQEKMISDPIGFKNDLRLAMEQAHAKATVEFAEAVAPVERALAISGEEARLAREAAGTGEAALTSARERVIIHRERLQATGSEAAVQATVAKATKVHEDAVVAQMVAAQKVEEAAQAIVAAREVVAATAAEVKTIAQDIRDLRKAGNTEAADAMVPQHKALKARLATEKAGRDAAKVARTDAAKAAEKAAKRTAKAEKKATKAAQDARTWRETAAEAADALAQAKALRESRKLATVPLRAARDAAEAAVERLKLERQGLEAGLAPEKLPANDLEWSMRLDNYYNTIINLRDGDHVGTGAVLPSMVKHRADYLDRDMAGWLNNDIYKAMLRYHVGMVPKTKIAERFGDWQMSEHFSKMERMHNAEREKLLMDPTMSLAEKAKVAKKLDEQFNADTRDLAHMRDILLHRTHAIARNSSEVALLSTLRSFRGINAAAMLGSAVIANLPDVTRAAFSNLAHGTLAQANIKAVKHTLANLNFGDLPADRLGRVATALEYGASGRANMFGTEMGAMTPLTKIESGTRDVTDFVLKTTGLPQLQAHNKLAVGYGLGHDLVEAARGGKKLKGVDLDFLGIGSDMWERIKVQASKHGVDDGTGFLNPNLEKWTDVEALIATENAVIKHVNNVVITPSAMEKPLFMTRGWVGEVGSTLLQFLSYPLSAMHKMVIPNIQGEGMRTYLEMVGMLGTGAAVVTLRAWSKGEQPSQDMKKFTFEAINSSGLLSYTTDLYSRTARFTGIDPLGTLPPKYYARSSIEVLGGPTASTLGMVARGINAAKKGDPDATLHALRMLTPGQNHWAFNRMNDLIEGEVARMMGGTGRFAEPRKQLTAPVD